MSKKISCFINTFNSEKYIKECLESVSWCDEIIIVDMYSEDKTLEIAKEYGAKISMHDRIGYVEPARAFALEKCNNEWIFNLDSDEICTSKLRYELLKIMNNNDFDVINISRRNFFFGKEILGSGWGYKDDLIPRFFKKSYMKYGDKIHAGSELINNPRSGFIIDKEKSILHFNYDSIEQFINKLNNYTTHEAVSSKYNYKGSPARKIIYHFFREVLGRFIYKKGYKDGWLGLYLSLAMAFYRASAVAKSNLPSEDEVIDVYKNITK